MKQTCGNDTRVNRNLGAGRHGRCEDLSAHAGERALSDFQAGERRYVVIVVTSESATEVNEFLDEVQRDAVDTDGPWVGR
jgi:hypothetical protein